MIPLRVYVDSSVLGGCFDREFEEDTRAFLHCIREAKIVPLMSDMVVAEIARAPEQVQRLLDAMIGDGAEVLAATEAAVELQEAYLKSGVLGQRWEDDAMHVALATLARVDVVASWNFKHLLDPRRARGFNGVNLGMGYGLIAILSPSDIVHHLEDRR
jgi:predicted nucleic acid-binding protein